MSKEKLKSMMILVAIIILLFIVAVGIVLAVKSNIPEETVNPTDVTYVADTNTIIIKNIISVSEDFGKNIDEENGGAFGYLHFNVVNQSNEERNFQIYITKGTPFIDEINSNYITFYLTDENNNALEGYTSNKLPSYNKLHYIEDKADSKSIYKGTLQGNEEAHFVLRVWINESYLVTEKEESFLFEIDARAI